MQEWNNSFSHLNTRRSIPSIFIVIVFIYLLHCSFVFFTPPPTQELDSLLKTRSFAKLEVLADSLLNSGDSSTTTQELLCVALIKQHKQLTRAEEILSKLPNSAYQLYLLAQVQCLQYKFEEAIETYKKYIPIANTQILSEIETKQYIIECQNSLQFIQQTFRPILFENFRVAWDSICQLSTFSELPYRLIPLPAALYGIYDDAAIHPPTIIAYPHNRTVGTRIVYANRKAKQGQRDLYLMELNNNNLWSPPSELTPTINTPLDEALGILSSSGDTLYFSSRGHMGMGGFDIFRSIYDPILHQWKAPENLGFPYNTPYDDYLLGLPDEKGRIILASNRAIAVDSLQIFVVSYDPDQLREFLTNPNELKDRALFKLNSLIKTPTNITKQRNLAREKANPKHFSAIDSDNEYQKILLSGYEQQKRADSLHKDLNILRERLWNVRTSEERKKLENQITRIEDEMLASQRKADSYFAKASLIEQEYITGQRTLLQHEETSGAYKTDSPSSIHLAKPAENVMQPSEIKLLSEIARQHSTYWNETKALWKQYDAIRKMLSDSISSTVQINKAEQAASQQSQIYVTKYRENIRTRYRIFSQCLAVAYIKGNKAAKNQIFAAESKAKECRLMAQSLLQNKDIQDEGEAAFFSLLSEELGNLFYELGFTYAWNMDAYRKKLNKKIEAYSKLLAYNTPYSNTDDRITTINHSSNPLTFGKLILQSTGRDTPLNEKNNLIEGLQHLETSPYRTEEDIPQDIIQPSGVIYRLQLGAYSNPIDPTLFQGMYPIIAETLQGGKIRKYYAGAFRLKDDADKGKKMTHQYGFPDAFVVAWYNGRKVTLAKAMSVENEVNIPDTREFNERSSTINSAHYSVIIGAFEDDIPPYVMKTIHLLAPGKEIKRRLNFEGKTVYYIDNYQEKIQAERLRDNLLSSGLIGASVQTIP